MAKEEWLKHAYLRTYHNFDDYGGRPRSLGKDMDGWYTCPMSHWGMIMHGWWRVNSMIASVHKSWMSKPVSRAYCNFTGGTWQWSEYHIWVWLRKSNNASQLNLGSLNHSGCHSGWGGMIGGVSSYISGRNVWWRLMWHLISASQHCGGSWFMKSTPHQCIRTLAGAPRTLLDQCGVWYGSILDKSFQQVMIGQHQMVSKVEEEVCIRNAYTTVWIHWLVYSDAWSFSIWYGVGSGIAQ